MPRTETKTRTLYQFDELSDDAKERARDWWRNVLSEDTSWSESVLDDAATVAGILGIDLRQRDVRLMNGSTRREPQIYWSIDRAGGVGFDASYAYAAGSVAKIIAHAPQDAELHRIASMLQTAQRRHFYALEAVIRSSDSDGCGLYIQIDAERSSEAVAVADAISSFADWIHSALTREYEWRMADEQVDEDIRANEYEFAEDGERS